MRSGNKDLRSLGGCLHLKDINLNALCRLEMLSLNLLTLGQQCIRLSEIDADIAAHITLNHTGHNILFLAVILIVDNLALFLTDFLKNYVLGILGCNTSEFLRLYFHLNDIAKLILGIDHLRVWKRDLLNRIRHLFHNGFFLETMIFTGIRINDYFYILGFAEMVLAGSNERILDCLQKSLFADVLLLFQYR